MWKVVAILVTAGCIAAGFMLYGRGGNTAGGAAASSGAGGMGGARGMVRPPMPVEFAAVRRATLTEHVSIVGNLIGAATVQVVPKVNGRIEHVSVKLGDGVRRGQLIAKVEDREIQEQVRQADASYDVARATIRQREADLKLAKTNLDRSRSLLERELLPRQTYDDTEARYQAALAQVDLSNAQFAAARARLDELKIALANTEIVSPVDGFVGKRFLDPGAFVSPNAPVVSVVDISFVRMVANLVEKDVKRVTVGTHADVEVDAYPGETFAAIVKRVAPVFDPATRTAEMEIEVPNPGFRLKPGMFARVQLTVATRQDTLTVPANAVVLVEGKPGVFIASAAGGRGDRPSGGPPSPGANGPGAMPEAGRARGGQGARDDGRGAGDAPAAMTATFLPVETGIRDGEQVEIVTGVSEGARVITTGATALKDGDRITPATGGPTGARGRGSSGGADGSASGDGRR